MHKDLSKYPPRDSASDAVEPIIPDPWQVPSKDSEYNSEPNFWKLPIEAHPLIDAAGNPEAFQLTTGKVILVQENLH
ncbi:MAG: hypothetical protein F6K10_24725 [Moorea sp. SIO2B7]|nr:hypothetical protein [Moorena sp. SIO2B7]